MHALTHKQTVKHFGYEVPLSPEMVAHYDSIGSREGDIALAMTLAGNPHRANVLEIGCGFGREAAIVLQQTPYYLGIDTAEDVIKLAHKRVPKAHFEVGDLAEYNYGANRYDVVLSFAALRHCNRDEVAKILHKVHAALRVGGVFYLSLPCGDDYKVELRQDRFGERQVVLYNPTLITKLAGEGFQRVHERLDMVLNERWFEIGLKKLY